MKVRITLAEARTRLDELIELALKGDVVVITDETGRDLVQIKPIRDD